MPYHPIWKEMKTKISSAEEVALALKKMLLRKKKVSIMGGALESGFDKLNHISVGISDFLLMNHYGTILKKYLGVKKSSLNESVEEEHSKTAYVAVGLIVASICHN